MKQNVESGRLDEATLRAVGRVLPYVAPEQAGDVVRFSDEAIFARYELTPLELAEFQSVARYLQFETNWVSNGVCKVFEKDYGLSGNFETEHAYSL
jgi:hypothetical protein